MRHVAGLLLVFALAAPVRAESLRERVDALAKPYLSEKWLQSACIGVIRDGRVEVLSVGTLRPGGRAPDQHTIFEIGSVSKTMTGILAAQQSATGDFAMTDAVSPLLGGAKLPERDGRAITVEDLLTHYTGLPTDPEGIPPDEAVAMPPEQLMSMLAQAELKRTPGTGFEYCNQGFAVAGHLLARRTGRTFPQLLAERLFAPLGMTDSAVTSSPEQALRFAPGFDEEGDPAAPWETLAYDAVGGVRSTVSDMVRYVQAQIEPPASPLGRAIEAAHVPRRATNRPGGRVGLSWFTHDETGTVWHNGMTSGYTSYVGFRRSSKRGVVVLTNQRGPAATEIGRGVLAHLHGQTYAPMPLPPDLPAALADYTGGYRLGNAPVWHVRADGGHLVLDLGVRTMRLRMTEPDVFYTRVNDDLVFDFQRENGRVVSLTLIGLPQPVVLQRLPAGSAD